MHSTSSYILSNDARATAFRRAVRSRVAHNQEYAMPGSGTSAQEIQREYLRFCREQHQGQSESAQRAPPPYMSSADTRVPPSYRPSIEDQAPPPYTSAMTPTAQLDLLLYSNTSMPPPLPEYVGAISTSPPPSYENVVCARTPPTRSRDSTNHRVSHQTIDTRFANYTTRTPNKQIHNNAIQALEVVVVPGNGIEAAPRYLPKKTGLLRRIKGKGVTFC